MSENPYEVASNSPQAPERYRRFLWWTFGLRGFAWTILWMLSATILINLLGSSETYSYSSLRGDDGPTAVFISTPVPLWTVASILGALPTGWVILFWLSARPVTRQRSATH